MAAGDRVVARRCGFGKVDVDSAVANGTGEPGRAGADPAGVSRGSIVFCGRAQARLRPAPGVGQPCGGFGSLSELATAAIIAIDAKPMLPFLGGHGVVNKLAKKSFVTAKHPKRGWI